MESAVVPYLGTSVRWIVGVALLTAGLGKLRSLDSLSQIVTAYRILPSVMIRPAAWFLPPCEISLGLLLTLGIEIEPAAALGALVFAVFSIVMTWNLFRGNRVPCGCFGAASEERIGARTLIRSTALLLLSVVAALTASPYLALAPLRSLNHASLPPNGNGVLLALITSGIVAMYAMAGSILRLKGANG